MKKDNSYQYISAILEQGSISEAAKALYISQPSLSQYIARIEQEIGAKLFVPNHRPAVLTQAGKLYMDSEERMRAIHNQMLNEIQEIEELKRGMITIGSSHYRSMTILVDVLPRFRANYPGIEVHIEEGHTIVLEEAAARNVTDFSVVMLPLSYPELSYTPLFTEEVLVALSAEHPLCRDYPSGPLSSSGYPLLDFSLLRDEPFIMIKQGQHLRRTYLELFRRLDMKPKIIMQTDDMPTAQSLAAAGVGVALVTDRLAKAGICSRKPVYFSIAQPLEKRQVVAAYSKNRPLSKAARALLEEIRTCCGA